MHRTSRSIAISNAGKVGLADEFGADFGDPWEDTKKATHFMFCRKGNRFGGVV
jgi:hypothetical protein